MQIGCSEIMVMMMCWFVVVVIVHPEDKDADSVYDQPEYSNKNCLVEYDIYRS